MNRKEETVVLSFRVPATLVSKVDKVADEIPRGSRQKVIQTVFIPAFDRYFQRHLKKATALV